MRDPSIESVQPTCQRSAPGFRVGCRPGENRTGGCRGSRRFTHFGPPGGSLLRLSLPVPRASGRSLTLPSPEVHRPCGDGFHESPTPIARAHRVTGERVQHDEGAPSIDDVRPRTPADTKPCRDRAFHRAPGFTRVPTRRLHLATATTATKLLRPTLLANFCNRRETRAHPPVMRFSLRSRGCPHARCLVERLETRGPRPKPRPAEPSRPPEHVHGCTEARRSRSRAPVVANSRLPRAWSRPLQCRSRRGCRRPAARTDERRLEPGCLPDAGC
jgi:hypothetical protein